MTSITFDGFSSRLATAGCGAALAYLNAGVDHRYTGIYRLRDGVMKNIELADKEGEMRPDFLAEVPLGDSFCQFVLRDGFLRMSDSGADARLDGHKYQGVLLAYTGVPIEDEAGGLWGTLCHFDARTVDISDAAFDLLQQAAKALPPHLVAKG
jgi:hypothetical protein